MAEALTILTTFVVVVLVGIFASVLSKKLGISNILLLILLGSVLAEVSKHFGYEGLPHVAMVVLSVVALALIVFEGSSKFDFNDLNMSFKALYMLGLFAFFNILLIVPLYTFFIADTPSITTFLYGCIFGIIVIATDAPAVFYMLKDRTNKAVEFLSVESVVDTPIIVILPFLVLDLITGMGTGNMLDWASYGSAFVLQIVIGLGTGLLVGILFFRVMKKFYDTEISPLSLITAALLAYVLAENLAGSGVISVAVLGFMFGNAYLAGKSNLASFNNMLSNSLEIIVFMLVGFIVSLRMPWHMYAYGFVAFLLIVLARYLAVQVTFWKDESYTHREKLFLTLIIPKGIATATMVFSLSILAISELTFVLEMLVITIIYSVLLATIVARFSEFFLLSGPETADVPSVEKESPVIEVDE